MHRRRAHAGFTMVELLAAIAIMVALAGVSTAGVSVIQKSMTMNRLDNYAKEIYVAAQNRLISMEASGQLASFASDAAESAHPLAFAPQDYDGSSGGWQRYYYAGSSEEMGMRLAGSDVAAVNGDMQGGFVIEFNPATGVVYSVLYTEDPQFTSGVWTGGGATIDTQGFYDYVASLPSREKADRRAPVYPVGYYCGGAQENATPETGMPEKFSPQVRFVNGNELYLGITCRGSLALVSSQTGLTVKATLSDGTHTQVLEFAGGSDFVLDEMGNINIDVVLDSMREGMSFADIAPALTPGANVTATVDVSYTNGSDVVLTPVESQPSATANSLFAQATGGRASIANARHLANVGKAPEWLGEFVQLGDVDFASTAWAKSEATSLSSATRSANLASFGTEYVNPLHPQEAAGPGLAPLVVGHPFVYEGQGNLVSNLVVAGSGNTGLFAQVGQGSRVSNLVLADPAVTGDGPVGALAGTLSGELDGCGVRLGIADENDIDKVAAFTVSATGSGAAGGLVGQALGGASIANCYAAIDVAAPQTTGAGGLVGVLAGPASIQSSYASGTVTGSGAAGGLVGQATGVVQVSNCYATSRVYSQSYGGGLVGTVSSGTAAIDGCRSLGRVSTASGGTDAASGGFAGACAGTLAASNCAYVRQAGYNDAFSVQHEGALASSISQLASGGLTADNSHPYAAGLMGKSFPFAPVLDEHWGSWPDQAGLNPTLAYFERYSDGTVGYYATTTIAGEEGAANVVIDTLSAGPYVAEDGYALLCAWELDQFTAALNTDASQLLQRSADPTDTTFTELEAGGLSYEVAGQRVSMGDVHAYRLPYKYQQTDRDAVVSFYDALGLEIPNEDGTGTLTRVYFYCAHFACTAVNPGLDGSTDMSFDVPEVVQVRTARQLNALSRYRGYWTNTSGTMGNVATFSQQRGIDFGMYETPYCGHDMNFFDTSASNALRNRAIGNATTPFAFAYRGNDYAINDLLLPADEGNTMFGNVQGGSVTEVALGSVYAPGAVVHELPEDEG